MTSVRQETEGPEHRSLSYVGKGLSPALTPFPNGLKAPLTSDLEFIQDNSLLLPPVPPLLPWGSRHRGDSQAPLPSAQTPREGRSSWKWEFLTEKPSAPLSLPFAARGTPPKTPQSFLPFWGQGRGAGDPSQWGEREKQPLLSRWD